MPSLRAFGRIAAMLASALWMGVTIYQEFFVIDPGEFGFKTPEMEQRLASCSGTFLERYRCKDELIIEKGQEDFVVWLEKVGWIFGPPVLLFGLLRLTRPGSGGDDDDFGDTDLPPPPTDISRWRVR